TIPPSAPCTNELLTCWTPFIPQDCPGLAWRTVERRDDAAGRRGTGVHTHAFLCVPFRYPLRPPRDTPLKALPLHSRPYHPLPHGVAHQAGDVAGVQFAHQAVAVGFHGLDGEVEQARDFLAGVAFGDELEDLPFPRGEEGGTFVLVAQVGLDHGIGD